MGTEDFEKPARLTAHTRFGAIIDAKLHEALETTNLTDDQKARVTEGGYYFCNPIGEQKTIFNLPLLEADSFSISSVGAYDKTEPTAYETGNYVATLALYREGSPFVYDEDLGIDYYNNYCVLLGPEAPPTLIHDGYLEQASEVIDPFEHYGHGSWSLLSHVANKIGREVIHLLSDEDCEHLLSATYGTPVDIDDLLRNSYGFLE